MREKQPMMTNAEKIKMFSRQSSVQTLSINDKHLYIALSNNRTSYFQAENGTAPKVKTITTIFPFPFCNLRFI